MCNITNHQEMQIKTSISTRTMQSAGKNVEQLKLSNTDGGNIQNETATLANNRQFLNK